MVAKLKTKDAETYDIDTPAFLITAGNDIEANIIASKLKSFDIPVIKKHRGSGGYMNILMGSTIFGVDLFVPSKLLDDAQRIAAKVKPLSAKPASKDKKYEESAQRKRQKRAWIIILFLAPGILSAIILLILFFLSNY